MTLSTKHALISSFSTLLILTQIGHAAPGMSDQQMQQMMLKAQEAQKCFSKLDRSKFDEIEAKGKKMQAEIKALCDAGKRDKAMSTAMEFSKQMENDPLTIEMRKCSEMMDGAMGGMPQSFMPTAEDGEEDEGHICDNI
jgi:mannitol-specific phosphotransferase system IIBC component